MTEPLREIVEAVDKYLGEHYATRPIAKKHIAGVVAVVVPLVLRPSEAAQDAARSWLAVGGQEPGEAAEWVLNARERELLEER